MANKKTPLSRRSFLRNVTGAAAALGAFGAVAGARAQSVGDHGPNNDTGRNNDRTRNANRHGDESERNYAYSDNDSGLLADREGEGRRGEQEWGSDNDDGRNADPKFRRRENQSGLTDQDDGAKADAAGEGRGGGNILNSDIDIGPNSDPLGGGRGGGG